MIKCETIGMIPIAKNNPDVVSDKDVKNYSFITVDNILCLVSNEINGDDSYRKDVVIPAGQRLNCFQVKAWEGQNLVIDGKHIDGGVADLAKGDVLVATEDGGLSTGEASGVHFVVTGKTTLTEAAVKARVTVA